MKKLFVLGCLAAVSLLTVSCAKDQNDVSFVGKQMTLSVGFENQIPQGDAQTTDTKTYLSSTKKVLWGTSSVDKIIYVFDTKGIKNTFDGSAGAVANQETRSFTGNVTSDSEVEYVLWTGVASNDKSSLSDGVFTGSTLKVVNPQTVSNNNSFAQTANIAVMKPGDAALRNVFGYIQYVVPAGEDGSGSISSVKFSADEDLAGMIQIDYSGVEPVTSIISGGSNELTVNTRSKNGAYVAGTYYAVLPVGTYNNFKITITPVDGEPFTLSANAPVVVERSKYTSAGELPIEDPNPSDEPEPEIPVVPDQGNWPNDEDAFDYGLTEAKTANPALSELSDGTSFGDGVEYTADKVTYCGNGIYKTSRWYINNCNTFVSGSGGVLPSNRYISFKINKPGTLSFFPHHNTKDTHPMIMVTVVMKKDGVETYQNVYAQKPTNVSYSANDKNDDTYKLNIPISEDVLSGIDEAATVYLFHKRAANSDTQTAIYYYPITWTPAK